ncbi:MAG: InlB B-repeat-containing protein [Bacteroidales bacterium]|nr:InlB B-repeat-containing protein [Candidatus Colicola equi]
MKHLFSFRQRPNETLTHSTTRGLNGSRMVVETTIKGRSNDCRMTLGRLSTSLLLLFALSFGFSSQAWAKDFYLDLSGFTSWEDASAKFIVWDGSKNRTFSKHNNCSNDHLYKASDVNNSGTFYFKRVNPNNTDDTWNEAKITVSSTQNLVKITGWTAGTAGTYTAPTFKVTYTANGGTGSDVVVSGLGCNSSHTVKPADTFTRTGWTFLKWNDGGGTAHAPGSSMTITGNVTMYAHWEKWCVYGDFGSGWKDYNFANGKVTISLTKGSTYEFKVKHCQTEISDVYYGCDATITATEDNYNFYDWQNKNCKITPSVTGDYIFEWKSGNICAIYFPSTVTFDANGHGTAPASQVIIYNGTVTEPTAPMVTGYTFGGWYKERGCTNAWNFATDKVTSNKTLYAKWTENTYSVTAAAGTGCASVSPTGAQTVGQITGKQFVATGTTGYHFVNWTSSNGGTFTSSTSETTTFKPTGDATITANYAENTHSVTISNDGNGSTSPSGAQTVGEVTGISITATPNDGFGFKEWLVTGGTISAQSATTTFKPTTDNATIQATFQSTAVYYDLTVGVCSSQSAAQGTVSSSPAAGTHIQAGTAFTLTATPETGYEVEGWYSDAACTGAKLQTGGNTYSFSLSATMGVYVKFQEKTFSVTVQAGTGIDQVTGSGANVGQLTGTNISATVKSGYTWSTWTGGTGTYENGATVKDNTFRPTAASTLTATATENKYNVTINTNLPAGASLKIGSTSKAWGSVVNVGIDSKQAITVTLNAGYKYDGAFSVTGGARVSGNGSSFTVWADGADGTITVNIAEDLSSNWYLAGSSPMFPNGWNTGETNMMKRATGHSTENVYYFTIHVNDADIATSQSDKYQFKIRHYKENDCNDYFGSDRDGNHFWVNQTSTMTLRKNGNDDNLYFIPTIAGDYEFKVDATNGADVKLTVTWPSYNCVYGDFDSWNKDTHKLEFAGGDEASTVVNITDISKSYQFLVLVNSNYLTNNASFTTPITRSTASNIAFATKGSSDKNSKFTPDVAGDYTFTYNKSTNKLAITYPALPTASTTATEKRIFNESELSFISGNGTEADPYKIYTDEALTIDITALAAQTNLTAKYQFGEEAATTDVLTKTIINPSIEETSILVKAFYESDGVAGTAWEKTIYYQGVATPTLYLTTSWSDDEAQEGSDVPDNVTIYYNTANYRGPATVTRSKDGADPVAFMSIASGEQAEGTYVLPDKNVQRQTFVATATANERTFTATKAVSIYRLVEITITDANHLMDHYYMWENGTNPLHEETAWPGDNFFSTLGDAHIFYVKYPSYTHFVLNNGKASTEDDAAQTIDVTVPNQSTCYTIGEKITTEGDDKGKYDVQVAGKCPNKLYVGDIDPVSAVQGEGVIVSPQVDIDPLLDANNLTISFDYGSTQGITCDQRGRSFMVTATTTGTKKIQVTYSIEGADPVTKDVTVNVTSAIMVQVKVPTTIDWNNHNDMWVYYFNHGLSAAHVRMSWKDCVDGHDRYSARVPLGSDGKVDFLFHEWTLDGEQPWLQTVDIQNVENSGCYTILVEQDTQSKKRKYTYDGGNCWTAYYVEIDMANGTVYRSNTVEDLTKQVSFFAPGSSEPQAKSGLVRIICNGSQKAVVDAATFTKSGIYTAKITANGEGLTDVAYYTGDYYIRTDAAEGGWNDYVKDSHKFTYFTPYKDALYDYYWVMNKKLANAGDKLNIKACIGNGINENLANMIEVSNYTDGYGDIIPDAGTGVNLRFGYNPETNYFERSILRGSTAGESNFLNLIGANIYNNKNCTEELNEDNYKDNPEWSKFGDISNWVYEKNIYVEIDGSHPSAQALLKSKAFNGTTIYQLGYTLDNFGRQTSTPAQRDILGLGTTRGTYNLRIIYDFKTNRIVSAWSPVGDVTYSTPTTIEADVLFVRHEDTPVAQVKLDNDAALVSKLNSAYFVMEIDGSSDKISESIYWFSVPFDCEISSIFGVEGYVTLNANGIPTAGTWGIQEYDGETRAQKGWYIEDTQTFWRWKHKSEKLLKGNGYILVFDRTEANNQNLWKEITREEPCEGGDGCVDGKKTVTTTILRLYFPSSESGWDMTRSSKDQWVEYEDWTCQKKDRKAQDSNWRLLGTNSYSNIRIDKETQFERKDDDEMLDRAPNFVYVYDRSQPPYNRYEPATSVGKDFLSFNCYMVQFSGRINWNQYTQSEPEVPTSVAARRVVAENELTNAQMTLSLKKGNNTEDNTYIYMDTRATTDFDNQMDLTKITDTRANQIYSVTEEVEYAGNTLPVEDQIVPLTVNINANGAYTFAMPEMTDGLEVYLMDNATNAHIDMAIDSYTIDLNKGKIADRFYLDVRVKERTTPTIIETIGSDGNPTGDRFIKVIQNDQLHIIRNGRIYNASGMELNR